MSVLDILSFMQADVLGYQIINNKLIKLFHAINTSTCYTILRRFVVTGYWKMFVFDILSFILADVLGYQSIGNN